MMRELELDGIHDDGEHLVLIDSDHERYTVRITEALRAAVRRDRPALGALQAAQDTPLSPGQMQSMLREGTSAEEIAALAKVPVEHVRRYEGPILAEREWTAQRAQQFPCGRGAPPLAQVVTERLRARQANTAEVAWDSWRRPDGTWTLELTFASSGRTRQAHWLADMDAHVLTALDDEARWISEETEEDIPRSRARLTAISSAVFDQESRSSYDPEGSRSHVPSAQRTPVSNSSGPIDEAHLEHLNSIRGLRPVPLCAQPATESEDLPAGDDADSEDDHLTGPVWNTADEDADELDVPSSLSSSVTSSATPALSSYDDGYVDEADEDDEELDSGIIAQPAPVRFDVLTSANDHERAEAGQNLPGFDDDVSDLDAHASNADAVMAEDPAQFAQSREGIDSISEEPLHDDRLTALPGFEDPTPEAEEAPAPSKSATAKKKSRRSMPKWDDIVFGNRND